MYCGFCGYQLPQRATVCPNCGRVTSPVVSDSGIAGESSPYDPTVASGRSSPQSIPATSYGSDPYHAPPPSQQYASGPYNMPMQQTPYPPPKRRNRGWLIGLIVGAVLLVPFLVCSSFFLFAPSNPAPSPTKVTRTATTNVTPTANTYPPGGATLVLNDPMSDNSKGYKWDEATGSRPGTSNDTSSCGFSGGAYHVSETQKGGLFCSPEAQDLVFGNLAFEAEISILKGDSAGVVIREDQSRDAGYTFFVDTQGNYTLQMSDAVNNANNKTLRSGTNAAINHGTNAINLIALVANGSTISAYVNNTFIDSVQDSTFANGQIGVYGQGDNGAYDVTASDVRVWRIGNALPTPTASQNPYASRTGTLAIDDPLHDNSKGYGWSEGAATNNNDPKDISNCVYTKGVYHISRTVAGSSFCFAGAQDLLFTNLAFEAKITLLKGDGAGLVLRYDANKTTGYVLIIGMQADYQLYSFNYKSSDPNKIYTLLTSGTNTAIKRGLNQTNLVAGVANGNTISVYVNNQFVDTIQDTAYSNNGEIALFVEGNNGEEATASDVRVWRI